jgi:hypothetical protein
MKRISHHQCRLNGKYRAAFEHYFRYHPLMCFLFDYEADPILGVLYVDAFNYANKYAPRKIYGNSPYQFEIPRNNSLGLIARSQMTKLLMSRLLGNCDYALVPRIKGKLAETIASRIFFCFFTDRRFLANHASSLFGEGLVQLCYKRNMSDVVRNFALAGIYGCKPAIIQLIRLLETNRIAVCYSLGRANYSKNPEFVKLLKKLL